MTDKEKISELKKLVDVLCDNISDLPSGCEGCWLWEDGVCSKETLYKKMNAESEEITTSFIEDVEAIKDLLPQTEKEVTNEDLVKTMLSFDLRGRK